MVGLMAEKKVDLRVHLMADKSGEKKAVELAYRMVEL
jgi:hypothetical protein